jgi:hypothetical protein
MSEEIKDPTPDEQRTLLQTIKFPPRKYKVEVSGRGGEIVIGKVDRDAYDYLEDNDIDINDFIDDEDNELEVPEEYRFIEEGNWYDLDDIAHENGATIDDLSEIFVYDEKGKEVWRHSLDITSLEDDEIGIEEIEECYITDKLEDGEVAFIGQSVEKGLFFGGEFTIKDEFDPTKIKIEYSDIEGWSLLSSIQYDGEYIDTVEYDTTGKGIEFDLILVEK